MKSHIRHALTVMAMAALSAPVLAEGHGRVAADADQTAPIYTLGAGDNLRISVFGVPELSGEFSVTPGGKLSFPLIGQVEAIGKTVAQLQAEIAHRLTPQYVLDPKVTVDVLNYRPFYILGEVNKPGAYPYQDGMTVQQAVAVANGYTYRGNRKKVFLRHRNDTTEHSYQITGSSPVWVLPGDTVRIGERYF